QSCESTRRSRFVGESVTDPRLREQIPWSSGIALEFAAKRSNEHAQVLWLFDGVSPPAGLQNRAMCKHPPRVLREQQQEIEFLRRQSDLLSATEDAAAIAIDDEIPARHLSFRPARRLQAPQRNADPRHQLLGAERFGHVVVGPGIERRNLV